MIEDISRVQGDNTYSFNSIGISHQKASINSVSLDLAFIRAVPRQTLVAPPPVESGAALHACQFSYARDHLLEHLPDIYQSLKLGTADKIDLEIYCYRKMQ